MHLTLFKCKLHLTFCNIKTLSEDNVMSNPTKDLQYQRSLHCFFLLVIHVLLILFLNESLALETNFYTVKHGPKLILTVWVRKWFWKIYDQVINFQIQRVQWLVYKSYIWMHLWDFNFFYLPVHVYCITISYGWTISYWSSGTNTKHHLQGEWKNKPLP